MKTLPLAFDMSKACTRALVEHPVHVIKNLFGYREVRYKGLTKNQAQLYTLFAFGIWCWQHDARVKLMGPVCLESGLAAGYQGCQGIQTS